MARRSTKAAGGRSSRRGSKTKKSIDFSQQVLEFDGDMEYAVEVKEASWEDGNEHPYLRMVFKGADEEYEETTVYHNASIAPRALGRTKNMLVSLGAIEEDAEDADIDSSELVGLKCMAHTYFEKDQNGTPRIRFDDFWPLDEDGGKKNKKSGKEESDDEIDYDELSDSDVKKLAKAMKIKGRDADKLREELADADQDEVREAAEELEIELGAEPEDEPEEKPKGRRGAKKDEEEDEPEGKAGRSKTGSKKSSKKQTTWTEDEVQEMSEDELESVIEESGIEVDLDEFKTLRKKKNAVIDALTEADLLDS